MTLQQGLQLVPFFGQIVAPVALLAGIVYIVIGMRMSKRTTFSRWQVATWQQRVRSLAHGEDTHMYSADDFQAMQRQWLRQQGIAYIGAGVGLLAGIPVSIALVQLELQAPFSLPFALVFVSFMPPIWGVPLGFVSSSIFAARRQAAARSRDITVAEAHISRKMSDYRSPVLPLMVALPAIGYAMLTILLAPHFTAFTRYEVREYAIIPPPNWILAIYPCALFLTAIVVEGCVWARVKTPASISSPDATLARGASMALLGQNLTTIYAPMMITPALMGGTGVMQLLLHTTRDLNLYSIVFAIYGVTTFVGLLGTMQTQSSEGQLGGRLTGWLWTKERTQSVASSGAEG